MSDHQSRWWTTVDDDQFIIRVEWRASTVLIEACQSPRLDRPKVAAKVDQRKKRPRDTWYLTKGKKDQETPDIFVAVFCAACSALFLLVQSYEQLFMSLFLSLCWIGVRQ